MPLVGSEEQGKTLATEGRCHCPVLPLCTKVNVPFQETEALACSRRGPSLTTFLHRRMSQREVTRYQHSFLTRPSQQCSPPVDHLGMCFWQGSIKGSNIACTHSSVDLGSTCGEAGEKASVCLPMLGVGFLGVHAPGTFRGVLGWPWPPSHAATFILSACLLPGRNSLPPWLSRSSPSFAGRQLADPPTSPFWRQALHLRGLWQEVSEHWVLSSTAAGPRGLGGESGQHTTRTRTECSSPGYSCSLREGRFGGRGGDPPP